MARILIVEDDSRTAEFVGSHLRATGHDCLVAQTGIEALNIARNNGVDLLVLDVMLPGGASGFEVCRRVRSDPNLYTMPILLLSAMSGDEEILHGLAQGPTIMYRSRSTSTTFSSESTSSSATIGTPIISTR